MKLLVTCISWNITEYFINYVQTNFPDFVIHFVEINYSYRNDEHYQQKIISKIKKIIIRESITHMACLFEEIYFISKIKDWLELHCKILINDMKIYDTLHNKYSGYNFNVENNIPTIPSKLLTDNTTKEELLKFINGIYPLFIKNVYSCGGKGTSACNTIDDLFSSDDKIKNTKIGYIVQPCIIGTIYIVNMLYSNGKIVDTFILKSSSYIKDTLTVRMQPFRKVVETNIFDDIIKKIGYNTKYTGIMEAEFFVTKNKDIYMIEYNPRFSGSMICAFANNASILKNYMYLLLGLPLIPHNTTKCIYPQNELQYFMLQLYQNPKELVGLSWIKKYINMKKKIRIH